MLFVKPGFIDFKQVDHFNRVQIATVVFVNQLKNMFKLKVGHIKLLNAIFIAYKRV